jgi:hypothetical protein
MTPNLIDRRAKLLQELAKVEEQLAEQALGDLVDEAWQHVVEARRLAHLAAEKDQRAKAAQDEQRKTERLRRKAELEVQLAAAESEYRGCVMDALRNLQRSKPDWPLQPAEAALLEDPEHAPVVIDRATYPKLDVHHVGRLHAARQRVSTVRAALAAL